MTLSVTGNVCEFAFPQNKREQRIIAIVGKKVFLGFIGKMDLG
jgi:hypothetical protein